MNLSHISRMTVCSVMLGFAVTNRVTGQTQGEAVVIQPVATVTGVAVTGGSTTGSGTTEAANTPKVEVPEIKFPPMTVVPAEVKALATDFKAQAQAYVDRQKEITKQFKGASVAEREQLKEQLKASRNLFLDQTKEIRSELKQRLQELKTDLKDSRPLEAGAGEGGGRGRRGGGD